MNYPHQTNVWNEFLASIPAFPCAYRRRGFSKLGAALPWSFVLGLVLRSLHSIEKIEQEVSSYYLADEVRGKYRDMMIAIAPKE